MRLKSVPKRIGKRSGTIGKRGAVRTTSVVSVAAPSAATETKSMARTEIEIDIRHVAEGGPVDAEGWPIVEGCWVRASAPSRVCPGFNNEWTGPVRRVVKVEGGRDHGRVLVYIGDLSGGPWGMACPVEFVWVRRKPADAKSDEQRRR